MGSGNSPLPTGSSRNWKFKGDKRKAREEWWSVGRDGAWWRWKEEEFVLRTRRSPLRTVQHSAILHHVGGGRKPMQADFCLLQSSCVRLLQGLDKWVVACHEVRWTIETGANTTYWEVCGCAGEKHWSKVGTSLSPIPLACSSPPISSAKKEDGGEGKRKPSQPPSTLWQQSLPPGVLEESF